MKTCHGLRARQTSRSNSSGVRLIGCAVAGDRVAGDVDREVADRQRLLGGAVVAADPRPDPGDELLGLERLDDVVVGARLQADDDVDGVALGGEHDDRYAGLGPDLLADVDAVLAGQHQVEQHDVGPVVVERLHREVPAGHHPAVETLLAQHDREHLRQRGVVVHDEDATLGREVRRRSGVLSHAASVPHDRGGTDRSIAVSGHVEHGGAQRPARAASAPRDRSPTAVDDCEAREAERASSRSEAEAHEGSVPVLRPPCTGPRPATPRYDAWSSLSVVSFTPSASRCSRATSSSRCLGST